MFEIAYSLEGKTLHIDYTIKNTSKEDMPYSFGLHPAFRVPQYKNEKFEDYSIDFEFNEEATQLVFDPSFNENIKEKKVQLIHGSYLVKILTIMLHWYTKITRVPM